MSDKVPQYDTEQDKNDDGEFTTTMVVGGQLSLPNMESTLYGSYVS